MAFLCGTGREKPRDNGNQPTKKSAGPTNPVVSEWETQEVVEWLTKIEQSEYSSLFLRGQVTGKRLLTYGSDELKSLGVTDIDDRKRIKREISALKKQQHQHQHEHGPHMGSDTNGSSKSHRTKSKSPMNGHHNGSGSHGGKANGSANGAHAANGGGYGAHGGGQYLNKSKSDFTAQQQQHQLHHGQHGNPHGFHGGHPQHPGPGPHGPPGPGPHALQQYEFNSQPPYGRSRFDNDTFAKDKKQDKQKYWHIWQSIVGNQDVLLQTQYNIIMKHSQLPQQDLSIVWRMATNYNQGRCQFEQFVDICKLLSIAISGVPLYLIQIQKLIWYHPKPPHFLAHPDPSHLQKTRVNMMVVDQAARYTAAFRGLPLQILESDDKLMKFADMALKNYDPLHFEINESNLIATFKVPITPNDLQALRDSSIAVIQNKFNIVHINGVNVLMSLQVEFPTEEELGLTPDGITSGGSAGPGPSAANGGDPYGNHPQHPMASNGGQPPPYSNGVNQYRPAQHQQAVMPQGTPYAQHNRGALPPPPAQNSHHNHHQSPLMQPQPQQHPHNHHSPMMNGQHPAQRQPQPRQPQPRQTQAINPYITPYDNMPPQQQHVEPSTDKVWTHQKKQELLNLLLSEDFYEEFRNLTQLDQVVPGDETKIRTKAAMVLIASARKVPLKTVNYLDKGVKTLQSTTKAILRAEMNEWTLTRLALILDIPERDIPEVYKGIIIEGLPDSITNDDDTIRKLDSEVLYTFIVSHIEVVDNVLRITFKKDVSQSDIDKLRRGLKSFLKDIMKLDKKAMKNVSLIPHTRATWRGETTTSEYDDLDVVPYGNQDL